jgi:hypothetical protein
MVKQTNGETETESKKKESDAQKHYFLNLLDLSSHIQRTCPA